MTERSSAEQRSAERSQGKDRWFEANFDGLIGPTHNYAGLAFGNRASMDHAAAVSSPRRAALEGLAKMERLHALGIPQAVLPPQERPHLPTLRRLGYGGPEARVLERVAGESPRLLAMVASASSMWSANAATVSPAPDCADGRLHFTPANLSANVHRSLEAGQTARTLRAIFSDPEYFVGHDPLPAAFADEGAANHTRLCAAFGEPGVEVFVFGRDFPGTTGPGEPARYPARQTLAASESVARLHGLAEQGRLMLRQDPAAVDAGVFHNDVIAVGHRDLLFYHERAFAGGDDFAGDLQRRFGALTGGELRLVRVPAARVSLADAVASYLFNSQLVSPPEMAGGMALILPVECREHTGVRAYVEELVQDPANPIRAAEYVDLRQSMRNGGGPACLRLRVELSQDARSRVAPGVWLDDDLIARLRAWVESHCREELRPADLADPALLDESRTALDELCGLLQLPALYDFQIAGA